MVWVRKTNLRGPRGFEGPRGLPGAEELPADEAVGAYLDDPNSVSGGAARDLVRAQAFQINAADFGIVGDGIEDDTAALNAAFAAAPANARVIIPPGQYRISGTLTNAGEPLHVSAYGAEFVQSGASLGVQFTGAWSATVPVTAAAPGTVADAGGSTLDTTVLSVTGVMPWQRGDLVKLWADDIIPGSQWDIPSPAASSGRVGQFFTVYSVASGSVVLLGKLRDPMTTGIRVARMTEVPVSWAGGTFTSTSEDTAMMFRFAALNAPVVRDVLIANAMGVAFSFVSCYGYRLENSESRWSLNNPSEGAYGYGVDDNTSEFGLVTGCRFHQPRHGYSSTASTSTVGQDQPNTRGRTYGARVVDTIVTASTASAFDAHSNSLGITFQNCEANNAPIGFNLRGSRNKLVNVTARDVGTGVRIASDGESGESWGHTVDGLLVDGSSLAVITVQTRYGSGHPNYNVLDIRPNYLRGIVAIRAAGQGLALYNTTVHASDVDIDYTTPMTSSTTLNRVSNSILRVGYHRTGTGATQDGGGAGSVAWVTGAASLLEAGQMRVTGFSFMADRLTQIIATDGACVLRVDDLLTDYAPSTGNIFTDTTAAGWVNYRVAVGVAGPTSFWGALTGATDAADLAKVIANSFAPLTAVRFVLGGNQTLAQLPLGRLGQTVILINASASATLTVQHGSTPRTALTGGTNKVLAAGQSLMLTFDGAWRQVTPI